MASYNAPMASCPACARPVATESRFCSSCGASLDQSGHPTATAPTPRSPASSPPQRVSSGARKSEGRFAPGTMLADRFRIVGLLGKGGMAEVYRADDLKLGQAVALKFLPEALSSDTERLERLLNEVRVARQIAHPNVCRVYDAGELGDVHFLSMEFVDGEDLASLLRRIGRLPGDKAVEIARQLCAGLAAAHERGVLHRDLKPENVMLDGRGKVRITDFGLAAAAESVVGAEARSGTPAYMSPEQLAGREATVRSDIYALGLVLYELFTGRRAFEGRTLAALLKQQDQGLATPPSAAVRDLDPAVERVILRCLEKEPRLRPASAIAVAAALPGGDPLAAALAAGETPSPEMVAAAGVGRAMHPALAWSLLAFLALGVGALIAFSGPLQLFRAVPFDKPPSVLEDRARSLLADLGVAGGSHSASGLVVDVDYFHHGEDAARMPDRWLRLAEGKPPVAQFWYRESPRPLVSSDMSARVSRSDPPLTDSNMTGVRLDTTGRLIEFYRVPLQHDASPATEGRAAFDWARLFAEARLDLSAFRATTLQWTPSVNCDSHLAWEGTSPDWPGLSLRVEAGTWRGRPVWFRVFAPWKQAERQEPEKHTRAQLAASAIGAIMLVVGLVASCILARRNLRRGRGDRRGATEIATLTIGCGMVCWFLGADHVPDFFREFEIFFRGLSAALLGGAVVAVLYLALEPLIRRFWPDALISWTRLLSGRINDSLVGAHALYGMACGLFMALGRLVILRFDVGRSGPELDVLTLDTLLGFGQTIDWVLVRALVAIGVSLVVLLLFAAVRLLVRWEALAILMAVSPFVVQSILSEERPLAIALPLSLVVLCVPLIALVRCGLVAMIFTFFTSSLLSHTPLTPWLSHWSAGPTHVVLVILAALAIFALRAATRHDAPLTSGPSRD
jgi:hypothetical protein